MLEESTWPAFAELVEAYRYDVDAVKTSSSYLHGGTLRMFIDEGFEQVRQIGKSQWVVRKTVGPV